jgi:hypothetical protein
MGRKKKYKTDDEKNEAQKKWGMEHYERNKETLKEKAKERYRRIKKGNT